MATFQVPQFIEQEAKIIGFLTLKQFAYVAAAGLIIFAAFYLFTFYLWLMITIVFGGLGIALAFVKINGQTLPTLLFSALGFFWSPRTYTWQRVIPQTTLDIPDIAQIETMRKNMSIQEKLQSIALDITTGKIWKQKVTQGKERYQAVTFATGERRLIKKIDY